MSAAKTLHVTGGTPFSFFKNLQTPATPSTPYFFNSTNSSVVSRLRSGSSQGTHQLAFVLLFGHFTSTTLTRRPWLTLLFLFADNSVPETPSGLSDVTPSRH